MSYYIYYTDVQSLWVGSCSDEKGSRLSVKVSPRESSEYLVNKIMWWRPGQLLLSHFNWMLRKCAGVTSKRKYRLTHLCESGMTHSPRWALHPSAHSPQQLGTIVFIFDSINLTLLTCHQHFIPSPLSLSLSSIFFTLFITWQLSELYAWLSCLHQVTVSGTHRAMYIYTHTYWERLYIKYC